MGIPGGPAADEGGCFQSVQDFLRFPVSNLICTFPSPPERPLSSPVPFGPGVNSRPDLPVTDCMPK